MALETRKYNPDNRPAPLILTAKPRLHEVPPVSSNSDWNGFGLMDSLNEESPSTSLPIMATANDVRELVKFLKRKPSGVTIVEAMNAEPRRIFDARKIAAYEFWGIIEREGERLKLTSLGRAFAEKIEPEIEIHRRILRSISPYLAALEWIHRQKLEIVTHHDVANYWHKSQPELRLSHADERDFEAVVVSFFSLCHAAELGTTTVGKRGQPARLRVETEELQRFIQTPGANGFDIQTAQFPRKACSVNRTPDDVSAWRVYVSVRKRNDLTERLSEALELADFEDLVVENSEFADGFLPSSHLAAMHQCQAAIFLLDDTDCLKNQDGKLALRHELMIEISVALALFDWRVVLAWNCAEVPPAELPASNLHFLAGNFDWETNVRLVRLLKSLRS